MAVGTGNLDSVNNRFALTGIFPFAYIAYILNRTCGSNNFENRAGSIESVNKAVHINAVVLAVGIFGNFLLVGLVADIVISA